MINEFEMGAVNPLKSFCRLFFDFVVLFPKKDGIVVVRVFVKSTILEHLFF